MGRIRPLLAQIFEKIRESSSSVLPIAAIVLLLAVTITPLSGSTTMLFLFGVAFLILGMSLFTLGAEKSMQALGSRIGSSVASTGKVWFMALIGFLIGVIVTFSEPDLQILADQVPSVSSFLLILTISVGVGVFLMIALLRIVFGINLRVILAVFYAAALILSFFLPPAFRPLAFDSGGVTTGPMTVPFLMSFGAGVSGGRSEEQNRDDSFGLTALASIGPILAVLVLGIATEASGGEYTVTVPATVVHSRDGLLAYFGGIARYFPEVLKALLPILIFTACYQLGARAFGGRQLIRIGVGILYAALGLTLFLTGANVGFLPTGTEIGMALGAMGGGGLLIPVGMFLGFFIVRAEPAVYVLNKLVEQMSAGAISGKTTGLGLSIGVSLALGLSGVRILTGVPILWILIPGYIAAILLAFFVPKIFVGIAFDSGGVASGVMMSAFVLPLCIGACSVLGGDVMRDAFGCVAFVAMAPIIAIEIMGLFYKINSERNVRRFVALREEFVDYGYRPRKPAAKCPAPEAQTAPQSRQGAKEPEANG